ncbi:hypothetical protein Tco_0231516 [Tanacetum coccineum]
MNPIATQQTALNNALVPFEKRLKIERCNARIAFSKPREKKRIMSLWKLSSYLLAIPHSRLLLKSQKSTCINFRLLSRRLEIQMHTNSSWKRRSFELIRKCNMLSAIHTDQMHQPWRTFAAIINRCISGKTIGLDRLRES